MRALELFALPLFAIACGGQVDSTGAANEHHDPNTNNPQTHLPTGSMIGSFDLAFTHVTASSKYAGTPPDAVAPSQGANARIDIASDMSDGDVMIAPQWQDPSHFASTVTSSALTLTDGNAVLQSDGTYYVRDTWTSFTFHRTSDGGLDGTFTALGNEQITEGDELFELDLTATGTVGPDKTAPDVKITGPGGTVLPWDPIDVRVSEPVARPFSTILSIDAGGSRGKVEDNADATTTTALLTSWSSPAATLSAISFSDPSGNASTSEAFPIAFFDPGAPAAQFTFDSATANPAKWDDGSLVSFLSADGSCESGGCAKVGPLLDHGCTIPNAGLAGVLQHDPSHSATLFVRYRILVGVDPSSGGGSESITPDSSVFSVEAAIPGQAPSSQSFGFQLSDLQTIPSTFGMTQATPWTTASISLPAASELGFGLRFGSSYYCGGPIFNENSTIVLVDSVTTD